MTRASLGLCLPDHVAMPAPPMLSGLIPGGPLVTLNAPSLKRSQGSGKQDSGKPTGRWHWPWANLGRGL